MQKVTAIVLTKNEEANIRGAIESCLFANEILVVDSYSTDGTVRIVRSFPKVTVVQRKFTDYSEQRNWAMDQASHEWVFFLDADEKMTPGLVEEIEGVLEKDPGCCAFRVHRENWFMGKKLQFLWQNDWPTRLLRKGKAEYTKLVHETAVVSGKVGRLHGHLVHDTYKGRGLEGYLAKMEEYTTLAAWERFSRSKTVGVYHFFLKPFFAFIRNYFFFRGVLDGRVGFIISCLSAWSSFLRGIKIWRMQCDETFKRRPRS